MLHRSFAYFVILCATLAPSPSFSRGKKLELCEPYSEGCRSILMIYGLSSPTPVYGSFTLNGARLRGWKYTNRESTFSSDKPREIGSLCLYYKPYNEDEITFRANLKKSNPRYDSDHFEPLEYTFYSDAIKDGTSRMLSIRYSRPDHNFDGGDAAVPRFEVLFKADRRC